MGSSHHGLVPLHLRLVEAGLAPVTVESSELLHYQQALLAEGTLLVLVSQSGRSAEILRLLETVRGRGVATLAVTNTADSPLAREATATVLTHAGEEATVSCKTYLAAQMALAWLGEVLAGGDVAAARAALAGRRSRASRRTSRRGARTSSGSRGASRGCARSTTRGAAPRSPRRARPASSRRSRRTARPRA